MLQQVLTTLALLIVSVTMLVRANDLNWRKEWIWRFRLLGFVVSGFSPIGVILTKWFGAGAAYWQSVDFYWCVFTVGIALVFVTTPYLPPWWRWLWKGEPATDGSNGNGNPPVSTRSDRVQALNRTRDENP